jgi:hypothetical protein
MNPHVLKATLAALVLVSLAGCGGSAVSTERVANLERRIARLETENARLTRSLSNRTAKLGSRLTTVDRRTRANDEALYDGAAMAQDGLICNFKPTCHVPLGTPGALFKEEGQPGRIFATPFP